MISPHSRSQLVGLIEDAESLILSQCDALEGEFGGEEKSARRLADMLRRAVNDEAAWIKSGKSPLRLPKEDRCPKCHA